MRRVHHPGQRAGVVVRVERVGVVVFVGVRRHDLDERRPVDRGPQSGRTAQLQTGNGLGTGSAFTTGAARRRSRFWRRGRGRRECGRRFGAASGELASGGVTGGDTSRARDTPVPFKSMLTMPRRGLGDGGGGGVTSSRRI